MNVRRNTIYYMCMDLHHNTIRDARAPTCMWQRGCHRQPRGARPAPVHPSWTLWLQHRAVPWLGGPAAIPLTLIPLIPPPPSQKTERWVTFASGASGAGPANRRTLVVLLTHGSGLGLYTLQLTLYPFCLGAPAPIQPLVWLCSLQEK